MISVNLIPRERLAKQIGRRRTRAWVRFLRGYCVVLTVGSVLVMLPAYAKAPSNEATLSRIEGQVETLGKSIDQNRKEIAALNARVATSRFVGEHPDWSLVMAAVSRARASSEAPGSVDIALDLFELTGSKQEAKPKGAPTPPATASPSAPAKGAPAATREMHTIHITGYASTPADALHFVRRLEKLDFAERVNLKDTHTQPLGHAVLTHFDIEISIPGGDAPAGGPEGGAK